MSLRPQRCYISPILCSFSSLIPPNLYKLRQITTARISQTISSKSSAQQFSTYRSLRIQDNSQKGLQTEQQKPITATKPYLRENIYTIPNLLTVSRILACPILGWSILHDDFRLATGLLAYAGISDLVCHIRLAIHFNFTYYTRWATGRWVFGP